MKKNFKSIIVFVFLLCSVNNLFAEDKETLKVFYTIIGGPNTYARNFDNTPANVYGLVTTVVFRFYENVQEESKPVYCSLMCGGDVIAKAEISKIKVSNDACFLFDDLVLPKGKSYKLVVPERALSSVDNPDLKSGELVIDFNVDDFYARNTPAQTLSQVGSYQFGFAINTINCDTGKIVLCREDKPIMEFPLIFTYQDFDIGAATCIFPQTLNFEDNIRYTFILPKGSVHSLDRDDIVNYEARHELVGTCGRTFAPIEYSACSVEGKTDLTELGVVTVDYSTSVQLAPGARLQLVGSDGVVQKEAEATLSDNGKIWTVSADFGGCVVNGGFSLCIPEATVVGTGSDITVNRRTLIALDGSVSSVTGVTHLQPTVSLNGSLLTINRVEPGDHVAIYDATGKLYLRTTSTANSLTVDLPSKGVYMVKTKGSVVKVGM